MKKIISLCIVLLLDLPSLFSQTAAKLVSPQVMSDGSVVFRMKAPYAKSVQVIGTWSPIAQPVTMAKIDSTLFEVKIGPLASDLYEYRFKVDSLVMLDPANGFVTTGGTVVENRVLVPGSLGDLLAVRDVPHGTVTAQWYASPTLGNTRRLQVYTPPGYENGKTKYPVLYLLHGAGGDEESWISRGRANYIFDNLIAAKAAVPMIVVITNGNPDVVASPLNPASGNKPASSDVGGMASQQFEESLVKDVIPFIEQHYRVLADPEHRAITGFSMGGYQTQNITNRNPQLFKYIGIMSMGLFSEFRGVPGYNRQQHIDQLKALLAAKPKLYWIGIGKGDFLYGTVTKMRQLYDEIGFPYTYRESGGIHNWNEWRMYLTELAPKYFK